MIREGRFAKGGTDLFVVKGSMLTTTSVCLFCAIACLYFPTRLSPIPLLLQLQSSSAQITQALGLVVVVVGNSSGAHYLLGIVVLLLELRPQPQRRRSARSSLIG